MPRNETETALSRPGPGLIQPTTAQPSETALTDKIMVVLVRPGVGARKYFVPPGTTVQGLLDSAATQSGTSYNMRDQDIMIDNKKVAAGSVLQPNQVVFMVPKPKNA